MEDQRTELGAGSSTRRAPTLPDEDFFELLMRLQSNRINEQRAFTVASANGTAGSEQTVAAKGQQSSGEASVAGGPSEEDRPAAEGHQAGARRDEDPTGPKPSKRRKGNRLISSLPFQRRKGKK